GECAERVVNEDRPTCRALSGAKSLPGQRIAPNNRRAGREQDARVSPRPAADRWGRPRSERGDQPWCYRDRPTVVLAPREGYQVGCTFAPGLQREVITAGEQVGLGPPGGQGTRQHLQLDAPVAPVSKEVG